jgi:hypothetical protein
VPGGYGARRSRVKALGGNAPLGSYTANSRNPLRPNGGPDASSSALGVTTPELYPGTRRTSGPPPTIAIPATSRRLGYPASDVLERARDRLQRNVWHALNRYDELKRRVRENQAGRSAVGFVVLLLLAAGATLGFVAANAAARDDVTELTTARASNGGVAYTVTQSIVSRQTVRLAA